MHQLVYLSRARRAFTQDDLVQLCARSASKNAGNHVTGLLLYDGKRFMQALEGEEPAVRAAMRRIEDDPRHYNIDYLTDRPIENRRFGDWAMDFKPAASGCCSREFLQKVKEDVAQVQDPELQAAFIGFALLASARPAGYRCTAG